MIRRLFIAILLVTAGLSACGTLDVSIQQDPTATLPEADPTKTTLEIEATSMSAFVTQQAATLYPHTPTPAAFDPLNPWTTYQDNTFGFSLEYPYLYDMSPYGESCGLKVNNDSLGLGHNIQVLFLNSEGKSLDEYASELLQEKGWSLQSQYHQNINASDALTIDYRFGGTNRFGSLTLFEHNALVIAIQFMAGDGCAIEGFSFSEAEVYAHVVQSFRFLAAQTIATFPAPAAQVKPILVFPPYESPSGLLLGGSLDGKWLDTASAAAMLRGDESYAIYTQEGLLGYSLGSPASPDTPFCPALQEISLHADDPFQSTVALAADWNALPRKPEELPTNNEIYQAVVADLLRENGIVQSDVNLTRILKIDLEGDGVDEILISASEIADTKEIDIAAGDYSLVVLRKVTGNSVLTIPLAADFYYRPVPGSFPNRYLLTSVLDLNGDGKMEVVLSITGWEKTGAMVFEANRDSLTPVLSVKCPE
jgi:hypothetical protein